MSVKKIIKQIRYLLEAIIVNIGIILFNILGCKISSNLAAKIAVFIGLKLSVNKLAYNNISNALPNLNKDQKNKILREMWDNLGRIVGEYCHIGKMNNKNLKKIIFESDNFKKNIKNLKKNNKGGIIISGHIGNWEIGPKVLMSYGLDVNVLYRPLNNPFVEKITAKIRNIKLIKKGSKGNREIIEAIKKGQYVVILADQRVRGGQLVKFFHKEAITTTSIAKIALKYDIDIIPARIIRLKNKHKFMVDIDKPIKINQENAKKDLEVFDFTATINQKLESWIKEFPAQWFWVHDRWKK